MKTEKTISIKQIKVYKTLIVIIVSLFISLFVVRAILTASWVSFMLAIMYPIVLVFVWMPQLKKSLKAIKQISYDDQHLYDFEKGLDTQVALERIRDVEITSLDGMYKFNLMDQETFGPYILCKTSMLYPVNFRKVDKELDHVRDLISQRKRQIQNDNIYQLPSYTA